MFQKILIAFDGSRSSEAALRQGADLARNSNAEVHILSIASTSGAMAIAEAVGPQDVWGIEYTEMKQVMETAVKDLLSDGLHVVGLNRYGDPADEIAAYAREIGADLVVLGHSYKSFFGRLLNGSISKNLMDHLACSLLVASLPEKEKRAPK